MISSYEWAADECLPACNGYSFHQESIQYIKVGDRFIRAMREDLNISDSIAITSMVLSLAEQVRLNKFITDTLEFVIFC